MARLKQGDVMTDHYSIKLLSKTCGDECKMHTDSTFGMTRLDYMFILILGVFIAVLGVFIVQSGTSYQSSSERGLECVYNCDALKPVLGPVVEVGGGMGGGW